MSWFIAKIVFNIVTAKTKAQFEEQLRLVEATCSEDAFLKAKAIGIAEEETLKQDDGRFVKWEFVDVAELLPIQSLCNGSEIYSQTHEIEEGLQYIRSVHQRGMAIRLSAI
jgi:Domain of unknown function (DUF4288)